jgi:transcriptional regulator with XRE-family HTH domain
VKKPKQPHEADVALGRRLKSLRIRRGLSQTALGKMLGLSFQQIQKYERGTNRIRVSQLRQIAEALVVPTTELLEFPRTDTGEIADMIDTRIARRLMDAFQSLTSRERRWSKRWRHSGSGDESHNFWQRRANVWRRPTSPTTCAERLISRVSRPRKKIHVVSFQTLGNRRG